MKTIVSTLTVFFFALQCMIAQPPPPPPPPFPPDAPDVPGIEKIEAIKIGFITKKLNLTSEESQKFWPVYNQFEEEKKQIRKSTIGAIKELKEDGDFTATEAEQAITKHLEFKSKDLDLTKKYIAEFKKVLPVTKVAKLITLEEQFKKLLMKQAQSGGPKPGSGQGQKYWKNKE